MSDIGGRRSVARGRVCPAHRLLEEWAKARLIGLSCVLSSLFCVLLAADPASGAKDEPFSVDCSFGWGGFYRPMEWTALEISIATTLKEPFGGAIEVATPQDEQNTLHVGHRFVVTADLPVRLPLATKIAYSASTCSLRLTDDKGRPRWRTDVDLWDSSSSVRAATAVGQGDLLIGLIGKRTFGILGLAKEAVCVPAERRDYPQGKVYVGGKVPNMVPWDWTGFAALDLLILYDPDWDQLRPDQVKAISDWISGGGKALVILGSFQAPASLLKGLGVEVSPLQQLELSTDLLARLQLESGQAASVLCSPLGLRDPGAAYRCEVTDANAPIFAVLPAGFGRVGVLGLDPEGLGQSQAGRAGPFWVELIRAVLEDPLALPPAGVSAGPVPLPGYGRWDMAQDLYQIRTIRLAPAHQEASDPQQQAGTFATSRSQVAATQILGYLQDISQMRPLSIWPVLGLLVLLALLIGPVDYLVLKRLDRQPWTWATSGFWIVAFTVGAYYGAQALRGGSLQLRTVSVLDGMAGTKGSVDEVRTGWTTTYGGLFAPRSDQYAFEDVPANQWWSGIAPVGDQVYQNPQPLGGRDIYCLQQDGGNLPQPLPVSIWTMQYTLTEQAVSDLPLRAHIRCEGDRVRIEVTNRSDAAFDYGFVLLAGHGPIPFGPVAAGATASYSERLREGSPEDRAALGSAFAADSGESVWLWFDAYGVAQRSLAMRSCLARGAAVVCVRQDQAAPPFHVKDPSCNYHGVQWVRLVVWPEKE